jgi:hypothetical protein
MSDGSDLQALERRVAALEAMAAQQVAGGGGAGAQAAGGAAYKTPAQWVAGAIASGLPQAGPTGGAQQPGAQAEAAAAFTGSSTCWCESRFVCATMSCGGSGWC